MAVPVVPVSLRMNVDSQLSMGQVVTLSTQDPLFKGHVAVPAGNGNGPIGSGSQGGFVVGAAVNSPPPVVVAIQDTHTPRDSQWHSGMLCKILTYNNALWLALYISLMIAFMVASSIVWTFVPSPQCHDNCTEELCTGATEYDDTADEIHPCLCTTTNTAGDMITYCEERYWSTGPLTTLGYALSLIGYLGLMTSPICCCIAVIRSCRTREATVQVNVQRYEAAVNVDEEHAFN